MPIGTRRIATIAVTATMTVALTTMAALPSTASPVRRCEDPVALAAADTNGCLQDLRTQAESAGRAAQQADEAYHAAETRADRAEDDYEDAGAAADAAEKVADASRERAAAVAAQLARTGGSIGQTTEVLMSGDGATEVLYHLSRMDELTQGTGDLAEEAARDSRDAETLRNAAADALERLRNEKADAKDAYEKAQNESAHARALVVRAEGLSQQGVDPALVKAYDDLPADASVAQTVLAFARAQIGEPYVFGAAGPSSWDCSGLTMGAFAATGRDIGGHGVNVQYAKAKAQGLLVPYSAAQPGDLLFYGSGDFFHVTIYSGGGMMIEAPYPGKAVREVPVRTDDLAPVVARFTG